jgi:hypothetical protein
MPAHRNASRQGRDGAGGLVASGGAKLSDQFSNMVTAARFFRREDVV